MAQYLLLIYGEEKVYEDGGQELGQLVHKGHTEFGTEFDAAIAGGNALQSEATATSVREGADGFVVTDGPFVETKEALGGYYLVNADDLDHAIAMAKKIPMPGGGVEIRPIQVFE